MRKTKTTIIWSKQMMLVLVMLGMLCSNALGQINSPQKGPPFNKPLNTSHQPIPNVSKYIKPHFSPGGLFDSVFDNRGKRYSLGQIAIDDAVRNVANSDFSNASSDIPVPMASVVVPTTCTPGYFQLYLETGCGMENYATDLTHAARLNVLCQVLTDISNFINSPCTSTGQRINIWVKNYTGMTVAGLGSPFFNIPYSTTKSGITDNTIWLTLNSGVDAFTNVASPISTSGGGSSGSTYFHGSIRFDFSGTYTWNTNLSSAPAAGEVDLYTVALHEMLHAMGFASLINSTGISVIGPGYQYYTRYDQHLQTAGSTPLITNTGSCSLYQFGFNTGLTPSTVLSPGCTGLYTSDHTVCATAIQYVGSTTVPVYTPTCFELGSSLSHFEDECYTPPLWFTTLYPLSNYNNQYFTMSNAGMPGPLTPATPGCMKRHPAPEERLALCDIGYNVNTTYGSTTYLNYYNYGGTACPGINVVGFNDGIAGGTFLYTTTPGGTVNINPTATPLLINDHGATGFKCVEVVTGAGAVTPTTGITGTTINYTAATTDFGIQLIRYIPYNISTGVEGNITYVYVLVSDPGCTPTPCDLVSNGGFENAAGSGYGPYLTWNEHCWSDYIESADVFSTSAPTLPYPVYSIPNSWWFTTPTSGHPFSLGANDHFVGMVEGAWPTPGMWGVESIQTQLSSPLTPGVTYTLSFWAKETDVSYPTQPTHMHFAVGNGYPLTTGAFPMAGAIPAGLTSLHEFTITHPDNNWHYYTVDVTYPLTTTSNTLVILFAPWDDDPTLHPSSWAQYTAIDDISIVPTASIASFTLPTPMCANDPLFDLTTAVSIPGGTFQWLGTGGVSTSSMFDPADAYAASIASGGIGIVTVAYTYTDALGCTRTVYAETQINPTAPITGPTTVCVGGTINLFNAIAGGTWNCTPTANATISSTGVVSGWLAGPAVVTYTTTAGCIVTYNITVVPAPPLPCLCAYTSTGITFTPLPAVLTTSPPPGNYYASTSITIPSPSVVNFTGCVVAMGPGVSITVQSGAAMISNNSHFFSCPGNMWQGIILAAGSPGPTGQLYLGSNTLIEDAQVAVDIPSPQAMGTYAPSTSYTPSLTLFTNGVTFNKNTIGVRISGYNPVMPLLAPSVASPSYPFAILNAVFTCRKVQYGSAVGGTSWPFAWPPTVGPIASGALKAPIPAGPYDPPYNITTYSTTTCNNGLLSQYAIQLEKVGVTTGSLGTAQSSGVIVGGPTPAFSPDDVNLVDNMNDGIYAHNSNLEVRNTEFMNIHQTLPGGRGDGIYSYQDNFNLYKLYVYGNASGYNNKFWDCVIGVETSELYNVTGIYAVMTSKHSTTEPTYPQGKYGYKIASSNYYEHQTNYNYFYNISNCIDHTITLPPVGGTQLIGQSTIFRNYISAANPFGAPPVYEYVNQAISMKNLTGPIYSNWLAGSQQNVDNNLIMNVYNGIYMSVCGEANVAATTDYNYITMIQDGSLTTGSPNQTGIKHENNLLAYATNNIVMGPGSAVPVPPSTTSSPYATIPLLEGIQVKNANLEWVHCNTVSGINTGFCFRGNNNLSWLNNTIDQTAYGFVLDGAMNAQPPGGSFVTGNMWTPAGWYGGTNFETYTMGAANPLLSTLTVTGPGGVEDPLNNGSEIALPYVTSVSVFETGLTHPTCSTAIASTIPIEMLAKTPLGVTPINNRSSAITIFPNPNTGSFTVSGTLPQFISVKQVKLEVIDVLGRILYDDIAILQDGELFKRISLGSEVQAGVYSIRIISENTATVLKFTVEK